jgi:NADH-quinone oxidoreductase subunit L
MVFRVFWGPPVEEARELEQGHLAHHPPTNPASGEAEDTDVGFPAEEHHIAEREGAMRTAMGPLAVLALVAGFVQVPGVSDMIEKFLEPSFADSEFHETAPSDGAEWLGLLVGGLISIAGISAAYVAYVRRRGITLELRDRFGRVHAFLVNKWYFDELFDAVFVRPVASAGAFGRAVVETRFVQDFIVGGATGVVRVGTSFARAIQTGYLRAYALLLLVGVAALGLYFLLASS